jgi:hypothetical protein
MLRRIMYKVELSGAMGTRMDRAVGLCRAWIARENPFGGAASGCVARAKGGGHPWLGGEPHIPWQARQMRFERSRTPALREDFCGAGPTR